MSMGKTVLVIGAGGAQGGPVAEAALAAGYDVRAAGRSMDKLTGLKAGGATPVRVDLSDPDSVRAAAARADLAFFHAPMGLGGGVEVEAAAVQAILDGGVDHLVYNVGFALPPEPVGAPPLDARIDFVNELLERAPVTVFVPTGYLENFSAPWSAPRIADGELAYPLAEHVRVAWVTNDDVGACAVAAFGRPDRTGGRRLRVAGPERLTLPEVADRIGSGIGHAVSFRRVSGAEYAEMLAPFVGEETARMIGESYDRMAEDRNPLMTPDTSETTDALGVRFTTVEEWARRRLRI
ncbi:MAG: NmrA family NAD(P)-binding protein [Spirochaetes bacterium]|jgi:uncharacterized protein YbjT (DUF2867 family)|nr:NmrA family NAD(P)-binding protein [Spirochaetota bacterium]